MIAAYPAGRLTSGAEDDAETAETEADRLLDPLSAPLMPSDPESPPPQAVRSSPAVAVSVAVVVVRARRPRFVSPGVRRMRQGTKP
jgi:hypothetical protein